MAKSRTEIVERPPLVSGDTAVAPAPAPQSVEVFAPRPAPPVRQPADVPLAFALPSLAKALAEARDRCKSAAKDSENTFHHYMYASADTILATANEALASSGLALLPTREELTAIGSLHVLNRTLLLAHESGESVVLEIKGWPVVPDRGRPMDRAYAMALTSSLAYKVRDLLQMSRGGGAMDDDISAQDDRDTPAAAPPQTVSQQIQLAIEWVNKCEARLVREELCPPGDLVAVLVEELGDGWMAQAPERVKALCRSAEARWKTDREERLAVNGDEA